MGLQRQHTVDTGGASFKEIGAALGVSDKRAHQIYERALRKAAFRAVLLRIRGKDILPDHDEVEQDIWGPDMRDM